MTAADEGFVLLLALAQHELSLMHDDVDLGAKAAEFFEAAKIKEPLHAVRVTLPGVFYMTKCGEAQASQMEEPLLADVTSSGSIPSKDLVHCLTPAKRRRWPLESDPDGDPAYWAGSTPAC